MSHRGERLFLGVGLAWLALDQVTKAWLFHLWRTGGPDRVPIVRGYLDILILTLNPGAAFGFLRDAPWSRWVFVAIAALTIAAMIYWRRTIGALPAAQIIGLGLVGGGAAGNLLDRLFHGGLVIDFIHFHIDAIGFAWPDFNVADIGVTCGMCLYLASAVVTERRGAAAANAP